MNLHMLSSPVAVRNTCHIIMVSSGVLQVVSADFSKHSEIKI